jgi:hypothetical protein
LVVEAVEDLMPAAVVVVLVDCEPIFLGIH